MRRASWTFPSRLAVRASAGLTPFYAPQEINGRYYVDGGFTRTTNMRVAVQAGATMVILIDPLIPVYSEQAGFVRDKGAIFGAAQGLKALINSRFDKAVATLREMYPQVTFHLFQPDGATMKAMSGSPMKYFYRPGIEELSFRETLRDIRGRRFEAIARDSLATAFVSSIPTRRQVGAPRRRAKSRESGREFSCAAKRIVSLVPSDTYSLVRARSRGAHRRPHPLSRRASRGRRRDPRDGRHQEPRRRSDPRRAARSGHREPRGEHQKRHRAHRRGRHRGAALFSQAGGGRVGAPGAARAELDIARDESVKDLIARLLRRIARGRSGARADRSGEDFFPDLDGPADDRARRHVHLRCARPRRRSQCVRRSSATVPARRRFWVKRLPRHRTKWKGGEHAVPARHMGRGGRARARAGAVAR